MSVVRFYKQLHTEPQVSILPGIQIRSYRTGDETAWLELRESAMPDLIASGRTWNAADFRREFTTKRHFEPRRMWLAESIKGRRTVLAGAIYLRLESHAPQEAASIQWLLVEPTFQRRGIGSQLRTLAESTAWRAGRRNLSLETLSTWKAACSFYDSSGYSTS